MSCGFSIIAPLFASSKIPVPIHHQCGLIRIYVTMSAFPHFHIHLDMSDKIFSCYRDWVCYTLFPFSKSNHRLKILTDSFHIPHVPSLVAQIIQYICHYPNKSLTDFFSLLLLLLQRPVLSVLLFCQKNPRKSIS